MIVMLLGDTHGNRGFTKQAITWASENGVDRLVQVGDFGYWPRTNNGQRFLRDVGKHSAQLGVPLFFIDGNHEDHLRLDTLMTRQDPDREFPWISFGKYPISYIPRGSRWEWDGAVFGAFGGAFSIDRKHRIEDSGSYGWFHNEVPDESVIPSLGKVDVLLTHDSPIVPPAMHGSAYKRDATSEECQRAVYRALVATEARLLIHGHWHLSQRYRVNGATIQGLACDQNSLYYAAVVFDTQTKTLFTLREWGYQDAE